MAARLGVSIDDVRAAAVKVVERGEELTVAAVAKEVECQPPSIYHHVPDGLFGLRQMVHTHVEQQLDRLLFALVEPSPVAVLSELHEWGQRHPFLHLFYRDELEHHWPVRKRLDKEHVPLLTATGHKYFPHTMERLFDAD